MTNKNKQDNNQQNEENREQTHKTSKHQEMLGGRRKQCTHEGQHNEYNSNKEKQERRETQ